MGYTGFHAAIPTPIDEEISLAESLTIGCIMRYGQRDSNMLRTDPAKVFSMMRFARVRLEDPHGEPVQYAVWQGGRQSLGHPRPTNDEIMTPSHPQWHEFRERLAAELLRPDFDFWYAPRRFPTPAGVTADFWPLCSAQLLGEMGFAIAESLALFAVLSCRGDRQVCEHLEGVWSRTKPDTRRPAFDGESADSQDSSQAL